MLMTRHDWNECPACGEPAATHTARPADPARAFGPGEYAAFDCAFCGAAFTGTTPMPEPEPIDAY